MLLVIDQITDKYLRSVGRPVTADLVGLTSVTESHAPTEHVATESEIVHRFEDLQCNDGDTSDANEGSIVSGDIENNGDNNNEHQLNGSDDDSVFREEIIEDKGGTECKDYLGERPSEYVEEYYLRPEPVQWQPDKSSESSQPVYPKSSEKPSDTEYYTDESSVNILAGIESESDSSLTLNTDTNTTTTTTTTTTSSSICSFEKVRPNAVPRRKEIKQGDWRTKLALFDEL